MALWKEMCVFIANFNRTLVVCVHGFYNVVCFSPNTTFYQFAWQTLMPNWDKSFFEINKAWGSMKCIYIALFTSANVTKCYTETQLKIPNSKRSRSTVARKNSLERQEPRKKSRGTRLWGVASPLLAVPGRDYKSAWPLRPECSSRCSNIHRWPAGSNNNHWL